MDLYLAGVKTIWGYIKEPDEERALQEYIDGINMLESFYYADEWTERVIPRLNNFLLDSGAFTFMSNSGTHTDWELYSDKYADFIIRNNVDHFFELDIDSIAGLEKVEELRERLERRTGKQSIPVFHLSRGKEYFVRMCKDYDYIAFGGILTDGVSTQTLVKYMPWFIETAHKYNTKIHGLGFTSLKWLPQLHFDSVDSTSWLAGNKYGHLYRFDGSTMRQIKKPSGTRVAEARTLMKHNFKEWVKYSKYAETHL